MSLAEYPRKRDFSKTPGARGGTAKDRKSPRRFVVQKHAARRLHYDFRLEFNGTQELGLAERTEPRSRGKAARCASRGSPARICRFRGCDSRGEIWSGDGTDLGSRH